MTTTPKTYRKRPIEIKAIQFTNASDKENVRAIQAWTQDRFHVLAIPLNGIIAEVYDYLHKTWVGVNEGDYIIEGLEGEFYPHKGDLFPIAYEEVK